MVRSAKYIASSLLTAVRRFTAPNPAIGPLYPLPARRPVRGVSGMLQ